MEDVSAAEPTDAASNRWLLRIQQIVEALGSSTDPALLVEEWVTARQSMNPRNAYVHFVDKYLVAAQHLAQDSGDGAQDESREGKMKGPGPGESNRLPPWCGALDLALDLDKHASTDSPAAPCEAEPAAPLATLWFGDIPDDLAHIKTLSGILYSCKPSAMPTPTVRKVVRRAYRSEKPCVEGAERPMLGYAFVDFRDLQEAEEGLKHFDGIEAGAWKLRVNWAERQHQEKKKMRPRLLPGQDPPLGEQLFPDCLRGSELPRAVARHRLALGVPLKADAPLWIAAEVVKACYRRSPREVKRIDGAPLPKTLLQPLLQELRQTRWPPHPHRGGMQTQHYLVLHRSRANGRGRPNDGYEALLKHVDNVLEWADPDFRCTNVAVTKDFQGSPHIDPVDVSFQYAMSLGDFSTGGELCVEGSAPNQVWVVKTKDCIAKCDGRNIHWVRGHSGGDRYSLIFYSTDAAAATPQTQPVYTDFVPRGRLSSSGSASASELPRTDSASCLSCLTGLSAVVAGK